MRSMRLRIRALMIAGGAAAVVLGGAAGEARLRRVADYYQSKVTEFDANKAHLVPSLVAMERIAAESPESVKLRDLVLLRHQVAYYDFLAQRYAGAARTPWKAVPEDPPPPTKNKLPTKFAQDVVTEAIKRKILRLDLSGCGATDSLLAVLRKCQNLRSLDLARNRFTDEGLAHLARMEYLHELILSDNNITDAGLVNLEGLKGLRRLNLRGTKITRAGLARLARAVPSVEVAHDPDLPSGP